MHSTARDRSPAQQRSCPHCSKSRISHEKRKKGWQVPSLLLLHVLADFSTSCSLEPLPSALLMPWGSPTTPSSWRASLCNQFPSDFLAELCRENVGFLAFCPSPSPADERELFMHENTQFASKLPLPSISNPSKRGDFAILCFDWLLMCYSPAREAALTFQLARKGYFGAVNCKKMLNYPSSKSTWVPS